MNSCRVTVCVPNRNHGHLIGRCINSLLSQTYRNFEIVISDDVSTDNSDEVIRSYKDQRIRYVKQSHKLGIWGNFKACLSLSQAPYALFLGADDYLKPRMLEACVSVLERDADVAFCHTAVEFFNDEGEILETTGAFTPSYIREGESLIEDFIYGKRMVLSSCIFRRRCFEEIDGWSIPYKNCFDAEIWFRMLLRWRVGFVGEILTGFRHHPTSDAWRLLQVKEDLEFLEAMFDRLPESLEALKKSRSFIFVKAVQRAVKILYTLPASIERDEMIRWLSPGESLVKGELKSSQERRNQKLYRFFHRALEQLPAPIRYRLGAAAELWRKNKMRRLAKKWPFTTP